MAAEGDGIDLYADVEDFGQASFLNSFHVQINPGLNSINKGFAGRLTDGKFNG